MSESSRYKAQSWPYPRHRNYESRLRKDAARWFQENKFPVHPQYPYILDSLDNWNRNIILPEVSNYISGDRLQRESLKKGFPLHKYAHHGLSSQAMLFNLIGPLICSNDLEPLKKVIVAQSIDWPTGPTLAYFEYENRDVFNEDSGQPTSIDLVILDESRKPKLFIEAKFVEREFGGCSVFAEGDCDGCTPVSSLEKCYLHFIGRRYWILLDKYGFLDGPLGAERLCPLAVHYQFFRELLFALELGGDFLLLYDDRNPTFFSKELTHNRGLIPLLLQFVPEEIRNRIGVITIQQVVAALHDTNRYLWIDEFEKKYGLSKQYNK